MADTSAGEDPRRRDQYSLYFSLRLSAIIAINSEFVGFPLLFWMVFVREIGFI